MVCADAPLVVERDSHVESDVLDWHALCIIPCVESMAARNARRLLRMFSLLC